MNDPTLDGIKWAERVFDEKLRTGDLPNLGSGYPDEIRAAKAVQKIANKKLFVRDPRSPRKVSAPLRPRDRQFWQAVLDWSNAYIVEYENSEIESFTKNASFSGSDLFDFFEDDDSPPSAGPLLEMAKRGSVLRVGSQRYEVLQQFDNHMVMVKKPGAKRKAFLLFDEGPVVNVYEMLGSLDTTLAQHHVLSVPHDQVELIHAP